MRIIALITLEAWEKINIHKYVVSIPSKIVRMTQFLFNALFGDTIIMKTSGEVYHIFLFAHFKFWRWRLEHHVLNGLETWIRFQFSSFHFYFCLRFCVCFCPLLRNFRLFDPHNVLSPKIVDFGHRQLIEKSKQSHVTLFNFKTNSQF